MLQNDGKRRSSILLLFGYMMRADDIMTINDRLIISAVLSGPANEAKSHRQNNLTE